MTLMFLMVEPKIIELKVNGKYLTLVGSNHGKFSGSKCGESDFLKRKYFYEGLIDESDIVVLEQPIDGEFYEDIPFFAKLGLIAYDYDKEVYVIDPNNVRANNFQKFLCEHFEKISQLPAENIVAIHGAQHTRPIAFYINNPELRQQKFEGYKRFNEVGRQGIKKFTPVFDINNMDKCIWKRELILPDAHTIVVKRI